MKNRIFCIFNIIFLAGCSLEVREPIKTVHTDLAGYWMHVESRTNQKPLYDWLLINPDGTGIRCSAPHDNSRYIYVVDYNHLLISYLYYSETSYKIIRDGKNSFFLAYQRSIGEPLYFIRMKSNPGLCEIKAYPINSGANIRILH